MAFEVNQFNACRLAFRKHTQDSGTVYATKEEMFKAYCLFKEGLMFMADFINSNPNRYARKGDSQK
jgi:hypothetical protein